MTVNDEFELVVFGATSFVGQILCDYLTNEYVDENLSWAMAARSESKLKSFKERLGANAVSIPILLADSNDENSLRALCAKASVIVSTVGPYALYGELLVRVCAETGTDYCDLTGEAPWIRLMIDRYQEVAQQSGARIVNSCGFDSLPSDLGVMFLQQQAQARFGQKCHSVKMRVKSLKGGASGGTIASGINMYKEAAKDPVLRQQMRDPYSLCPNKPAPGLRQRDGIVGFDQEFDSWVGPFVMEAINTRIVLRSNAICRCGSYSELFRYSEGTLTGRGLGGLLKAKSIALSISLVGAVLSVSVLRNLLVSSVLPKPGEGPSKEQQLAGSYDLRFLGLTQDNKRLWVKVTGDRDPGYGSTAKMLAQAAISLHRDTNRESSPGGFWTPATVFNDQLLNRLRGHGGMAFECVEGVD